MFFFTLLAFYFILNVWNLTLAMISWLFLWKSFSDIIKRQGFFNLTVLHFLLLSKSIRKIQPCFLNFSWSFKSTPLHPVIFLFLSLSIHCLIFIALSNFSSVCSFVLAGIPSQFGAFLMSACNAGDLGSIPGLGRSLGEWIGYPLQHSWTSLVARMVKTPARNAGYLGWDDPLEEGMATHSSILAWRLPMDKSLGGYSPWGCKA